MPLLGSPLESADLVDKYIGFDYVVSILLVALLVLVVLVLVVVVLEGRVSSIIFNGNLICNWI